MPAEDRRRQLLEVAAELFAQHGFRATTTADLASAAGISEPVLYRHFKSKRDMFITLLDEVGADVIDAWRSGLEGIEEPAQRLKVLLASNPATHARGRGVYRVIFQAMSEVDNDRTIATALRRHLIQLHAFLVAEVQQLQAAGVLRRDKPAETIAWLLIDVAIGYGLVAPLGITGQSQEDRAGMKGMIEDLLVP